MTDRRFYRWASPAVVVLVVLMMLPWAAAAAAAAPQRSARSNHTWLPFDEGRPVGEAFLSVTTADASAIDLAADLPGCSATASETDAGLYTRLGGEGYGFPSEEGLPELPVLRRDVEIPFGARVTLEVLDAGYHDYTLAELGLAPIYPLQPPLVKEPGAEDRPFVMDEAFYRSGDRYPDTPVRLGETYVVRGHRVQMVEVWPVAFDPAEGTVRLYHTVHFRLALDGADVARTEALAGRYASPAFEASLARRILNYNQGQGVTRFAPDTATGYLIITADAYYDALQPFVTLKTSRGFDVTVTRVSEVPGGSSNTAIKAYIQNAYDTWPLPPSYVLLVGDTDTVPGWQSVSAGEITDLYYATMDGSTDWHPDIGRGRFPVRSVAQTTIIVDKYLEYGALTGNEAWLKGASFLASCDPGYYGVAEATHNYAIDNYTLPGGYTGIFPNNPQPGGDKLYCITYGATATDIQASVNQGRWSVIYSGHGGYTGWEMGYGSDDVSNLTNAGMYPFVASHACVTGDFEEYEVYGETWVLQEEAGALVFWGSSDSSYWGEDDVLERATFDSFFDDTDGYPDVTEMTYWGLAATEASYPSMARYYWETYNVLGDPAVKIFMEPEGPYAVYVEPSDLQVCAGEEVTATVNILSLSGLTETISLDAGPLPGGVAAAFDPPAAPAPFVSKLMLSAGPTVTPGQYQLTVTATNGIDWEGQAVVDLGIGRAPAGPVLLSPADGASAVPPRPTLQWAAAPDATSYRVQLARDPFLGEPLYDVSGIAGTSYRLDQPLEGGRCHWWRVQAANACGEGPWSEVWHFCSADMAQHFYDDIESGPGLWSHAAAQGDDDWAISNAQSHSPTHAWHVPDSSSITDSYLWNTGPVAIADGTTLSFWHRYQFQGASYDGAVLEISTDGLSWSDLGAYIIAGGYNGVVNSGYGNPLGGREAWTADLTTWTEVEVGLSAFAGETAHVRWRIGTDSMGGDVGWYIDDVTISSPLPLNPPPQLLDIIPDQGPAGVEVPVEVHGSGFVETPLLQLGNTWLLSVTQVSSTTLEAVVPAMTTTGTYTLTLINGDCQQVTIIDAYRVVTQPPTFTLEVTPAALAVCAGGTTAATAAVGSVAGYSATVALSAEGLPYGADATFDPTSAPVPFDADVTVTASQDTPPGSQGMWVRASEEAPGRLAGDRLVFVPLEVIGAVPGTPLPVSPADGAVGQPLLPTFTWDPATRAAGYHLQVARSPLFEAPLLDLSGLTTTTYTATQPLVSGRSHWWRVGADNVCGEGSWSDASFFCTTEGEVLPPPDLFSVTPAVGAAGSATPVRIDGSGFVETPAVRLGGTWLLSVTQVSSTTLEAVVPAGMSPGSYALTLVNGDCQAVVLEDAFTVTGYGVRLYLPLVVRRGE